jgi:hypothetical protein
MISAKIMKLPMLFLVLPVLSVFSTGKGETISITDISSLQADIDRAIDGDTLIISEGMFTAVPTVYNDPLCGNCLEHKTEVSASYGFIVKNKSLHIKGTSRDKTILATKAGYGFFFITSPNSSITNLTITGGIRDADGNATNAAIVIRNSRVAISNLDIIDNNHRIDTLIIGIAGVIGREGAEFSVTNCTISGNGWDGVALYRGASAIVTDCLIENGRGAGIGATWDASCTAYRNIVTDYWKGIGAFGTSWLIARNNAVFDNLGWGIISTHNSYTDITNNIVHHNGNCGVAICAPETRGRIVNNIVTANGWEKEWVCERVGVLNYGNWSNWEFSHNIVWNNVQGNYLNIWDQTDTDGNLSVNPEFTGESVFLPRPNSPAIDSGHPDISDPDGSRSDIGIYGGPQAKSP